LACCRGTGDRIRNSVAGAFFLLFASTLTNESAVVAIMEIVAYGFAARSNAKSIRVDNDLASPFLRPD
jgi:hypothetical protein